ncbi:hypothetical protein FPHYL_7775 [Fusarium phyllophilum]|uniref:Uncharacterized protein n=1 Tax=Fusarium phyllophilum TaxID=47803 RepID=A0A8H5JMB1_9HYPO|nr:hypothetical protein FPHYL_7775 [Fusarium phyllophilum]
MSFGFGVGDFIAVGELCWKIYTRIYKVSRDAPEELRALIQELGNLSNTMTLLNEELQDTEEWMRRAGERRLEYTCKVMGQAKETLQKMDRLADKYAELDPGVNSQGSKRSLRIQWNRIKYALEVSSINELRAKFMSHNSHLTLLLQGAQNSSLERIEQQQTKTDIKLEELRNVLVGDRRSRNAPLLKGPLDEQVRAELSAAFLRSAETDNRPWASIGIDEWLQAGKWWLLKARSQVNHLAQGSGAEVPAYINLLKACWILTEIVSIHPQRTHLGASNDRRNDDIRNLSEITKTSLERFPIFDFQLHDVEDSTINIWPQAPPSSTITPRRQFRTDRDKPSWQTSGGEVLFQCFVELKSTTTHGEPSPEECFLMLEVPQQGICLNLILQSFSGQDIHKLRYRNALQAILLSLQLFNSEFRPPSLSASTVHSLSVIANWPYRHWNCLLLPGYDVGSPPRSDSLALLLRTVLNNIAKKGDQDKCPSSRFVAKDCSDVEVPLGAFAWKVICWHCESFADFRSLLQEFNVADIPCDFVLQTAFLRLDPDFLCQLVQLWKREDGWRPSDLCLMVEAALTCDDVRYILWVFRRVAASKLSDHMTEISQLVYRSRRLQHVDAMMQVVVPRPEDVAATLAWFLGSSDEQGFKDFLHLVRCHVGSFDSKTTENLNLSNFYPIFVAGCSRLIETRRPNTLSLYLESLEGLGIDFQTISGRKNTDSSQLTFLSALASPDPAFLRLLLEREAVVVGMRPFMEVYIAWKNWEIPMQAQYSLHPTSHSTLYCAAVLVCDAEFLKLLCQPGASLQQDNK